VPLLADLFGRKWNTIINYSILIFVTIWLIFSHRLIDIYIFIFIAGATWAGRIIVGLNWLVEFQPLKNKQLVVFIKMCSVSFTIIIFTFLFQFVTKNWRTIAWIFVTLCTTGTIYAIIFVPESA
jgi:MFS family permease